MKNKDDELKRIENIEKGLPARSHFSWNDDEMKKLIRLYNTGSSFDDIALSIERSPGSVAAQLKSLGLISEDEYDLFRNEYKKRNPKIKKIIETRKIERLAHFTQIENLPSIIENGLLGRQTLEKRKISYHFNDHLRLDNLPDAICCSISFPNYKLFYSLRQVSPNIDWAVICIKPDVLWLKNCLFCTMNAAHHDISNTPIKNRSGEKALENLFSDYDEYPKRTQTLIPDSFTTHPQAEVLVLDNIEQSFFIEILFNDNIDIDKINTLIAPYETKYGFEINKKLFGPRQDYPHW